MQRLFWIEDFNDPSSRPLPAPEPPPALPEPDPDPRPDAWTEGFLAGHRAASANAAADITAELVSRIADMEKTLATIADQSAATVAGLLIDMLAAARPPDWPADTADRLAKVQEAIRPVFALEPLLPLGHVQPGDIALADLPGLLKAVKWNAAGAGLDAARLARAIGD
jgi:hypothetical protein